MANYLPSGFGLSGMMQGISSFGMGMLPPQPKPGTFGSQFTGMGGPRRSGRSYLDQGRMAERDARRWDRGQRRALADMELGGGGGGRGSSRGSSRGGGAGGGTGGLPQIPLMPMTMGDINDQALINYGNAPGLGQEMAGAQARVQGGIGGLGDFGMIQQRNNPSLNPEANMAQARMRFRQMSRLGYGRPGGLVGAAQQALFS